ncbi:hypothetical protein T09_2754 [Trichinella sp. T9]|nr:hypothetical protein T09_2754 [Trichinella sp. T9]
MMVTRSDRSFVCDARTPLYHTLAQSARRSPYIGSTLVIRHCFHRVQYVRSVRTQTYIPQNEPAHDKIRTGITVPTVSNKIFPAENEDEDTEATV